MSLQGIIGHHPRVGFPRVSGDEPLQKANRAQVEAFSPRERG